MEEQTMETVVTPDKGSSGLSLKGLWEVFYKPADFFTKIKETPKVLLPYLALFVLTLILMFSMQDLIVKAQMESPEMQERLQGQEMPPQAMQFMKYSILVAGTLSVLLIPLISSALALFFGNFVFAGKAKYKQLLSIMLYSEILFIIGAFVVLPMMLSKGSMMVSLSPAILVADQGMQSIAYVALSKLNIFYIWEIIVAGIGLSIIYEFTRNKGYMLSVLSLGLLSILHIILTAIGTMFS